VSTANELRELTVDELRGRVQELRQQLFDMKTKHNTGILDSTANLGETRRQIARCLTLARQKALGVDKPAKVTKAGADQKAGKAKE
jgi:large subunit ribosomal protein L29